MRKKLARSSSDKVLMGVIGGIARYLGINSTLLRILFVIGLFPTAFTLIILYTILSYVMPREKSGETYE